MEMSFRSLPSSWGCCPLPQEDTSVPKLDRFMAVISIRLRTNEAPDKFLYALSPLGRIPDHEEDIRHKNWTLFDWLRVTEVEIDRVRVLAKMHDVKISVGTFSLDHPTAICFDLRKPQFDDFFDITARA